eukprot:Opistho-2@89968
MADQTRQDHEPPSLVCPPRRHSPLLQVPRGPLQHGVCAAQQPLHHLPACRRRLPGDRTVVVCAQCTQEVAPPDCQDQGRQPAWIEALQDVITSKVPAESQTEKLIGELKTAKEAQVAALYAAYPVLRHSDKPITQPLLPLPYGQLHPDYRTLHEEAIDIFRALLEPEHVADPVPLIQTIVKACLCLPYLKSEVYCQVIKQLINPPKPGGVVNLRDWLLLAVLCASCIPARKFVRYLRFHLKRVIDGFPNTEMAAYADFCMTAIDNTKHRELPPSKDEIESIRLRKPVRIEIALQGDKSMELDVTSSWTAEEVIEHLHNELGTGTSTNRFGLCERICDRTYALEDKRMLMDVLARWEARGAKTNGSTAKFAFCIVVFCETDGAKIKNSKELEFLFEQAHNDLIGFRISLNDDTRAKLAALRMQAKLGDCNVAADLPDIKPHYPLSTLAAKAMVAAAAAASPSTSRFGTLKKGFATLRGFGSTKDLNKSSDAAASPAPVPTPAPAAAAPAESDMPPGFDPHKKSRLGTIKRFTMRKNKSLTNINDPSGGGEDDSSDMAKAAAAAAAAAAEPSSPAPSAGSASPSPQKKTQSRFGTLKAGTMNTLRRVASLSSLASEEPKEKDPWEGVDYRKLQAAVDNEWQSLAGKSAHDAMREYVVLTKASWPGFGSTMFDVENFTNKIWPKLLTLGINMEGVNVFKRDAESILFVSYMNIISFSAPNSHTYKLAVDDHEPLIFETKEVLAIAKLIKAYISEITRRMQQRQSTISSSSSYASSVAN